jgi:catechol 2,3-dioxygenase-like lactoylglutathione lyase family enzyme
VKFDHVAINVADVARSVAWYKETLGAEVLYQDASWAFLRAGGAKLALTLPEQHPAHVAYDVGSNPPEAFFKGAKVHRDGSVSKYVRDPDGNALEWIHYPEGTGQD